MIAAARASPRAIELRAFVPMNEASIAPEVALHCRAASRTPLRIAVSRSAFVAVVFVRTTPW